MDGYKIKVEIGCSDYEGAITAFKRAVQDLEREKYRLGYSHAAGGRGSGGGWTNEDVSVSGPPQPPLTDSELSRLRALLSK